MTRYFIADPHFGHEGIVRMMARMNQDGKLFSCIEEHDRTILDEINNYVDRDDELIIVGDFCWDKPGRYRQQINCKNIRFVRGNHDKVQKSLNVFGQLHDILWTEIRDHSKTQKMKLVVSHYAQIFWDGSHRGTAHIYGHCHGQREQTLDELFPGRRSMDVGVDVTYSLYGYYGPISEHQIYERLAARSGHDDVRFYHDYQAALYHERGLL